MNPPPVSPRDALARSRFAADLDADERAVLAGRMTSRTLADGEVLVAEGHTDDRMHLIVDGAVAVVRGAAGEAPLLLLGPDDTVGELSFLDDHTHYASFVARGPTRVLTLARADLEALLDGAPRVVYRTMRAIARRVHANQHRLAAQAGELANYVYKQHGRY